MRGRTAVAAAAMTVLSAACGQQPPQRSPLPPIPEDISYPATTTARSDPIPDDGECYLVDSVGARVLSTQDGFDVAGHLESGDVIVGIDGMAVTSQETLLAALAPHAPGDVVTVGFTRDGMPREVDTVLGARIDDPASPLLGVIVDPAVVPKLPRDVATFTGDAAGRHLLIADEEVYLLDPLRGEWSAIGAAVPEGPLLLFAGRPYTVPLGAAPTLTPLLGGDDAVPLLIDGEAFITALTSIDDLVITLLRQQQAGGEGEVVTVVAVDTAAGRVTWTWVPPTESGTTAIPLLGYRSPDGSRIALTSDLGGSRVHTILDVTGEALGGFGTPLGFAPTNSAFVGWYDTDTAGFALVGAGPVEVVTVDLADFSTEVVATFSGDEGLRQLWSVGDGRHLMALTQDEAWIYDVARKARGRTLSRGCDIAVREGPAS